MDETRTVQPRRLIGKHRFRLEICGENQPSDCFEIVTFVTQQVITAATQSKRVYGHSGAFGLGGFGQKFLIDTA